MLYRPPDPYRTGRHQSPQFGLDSKVSIRENEGATRGKDRSAKDDNSGVHAPWCLFENRVRMRTGRAGWVGWLRLARQCFGGACQRQRILCGLGGPATGISNRCVGKPVQRRWAEAPKGVQMLRCAVAFVLGQAVLRIHLVELGHAPVAFDLGQDRGGGDGDRAGVPWIRAFCSIGRSISTASRSK